MDVQANFPKFYLPIREKIERYPDGEICMLMSLDDSHEIAKDDIKRITSICSEDLVYKTLFKDIEKFSNGYVEEHAKGFVEFAKDGWRTNSSFVFLIRDAQNTILAAIDIKTNNREAGEVGYWATSEKPGVMTAGLKKLIEIARNAGYKKLFALVKITNSKSSALIIRAGFKFVGEVGDNGVMTHNRYELML